MVSKARELFEQTPEAIINEQTIGYIKVLMKLHKTRTDFGTDVLTGFWEIPRVTSALFGPAALTKWMKI